MKATETTTISTDQPIDRTESAPTVSTALLDALTPVVKTFLIEEAQSVSSDSNVQEDLFAQDTDPQETLAMGVSAKNMIHWAEIIAADPQKINDLPDSLKREPIFYEHIAMTNPQALLSLDYEMRQWCGNNFDVMEKAVTEDGQMLRMVGNDLLNDRRYADLARTAVKENGSAYTLIRDPQLLLDKDLVLLAVSQSRDAATSIPTALLEDPKFVQQIVSINMNTFPLLEPRLKQHHLTQSLQIGEETRYAMDTALSALQIADTGAINNHRELIRNRVNLEEKDTQKLIKSALFPVRGFFDGVVNDTRPICIVCQDDMRREDQRETPGGRSKLEVERMMDGYRVLYFETKSSFELVEALRTSRTAGQADVLRIHTRGDQDGLDFSTDTEAFSHLSVEDISQLNLNETRNVLRDNGLIIIDSPYAGAETGTTQGIDNPAELFHAAWPQANVLASKYPATAHLTFDDTTGLLTSAGYQDSWEVRLNADTEIATRRNELLAADARGEDISKQITASDLTDPEILKKVLAIDPGVLSNMHESWLEDNATTIVNLLSFRSDALQYLPESVRSDKEFLLHAVENGPGFRFLNGTDPALFEDVQFVKDLVEADGRSPADFPASVRSRFVNDREVLSIAIANTQNCGFLQYADQATLTDFALMSAAAKQDANVLQFIDLSKFSGQQQESIIQNAFTRNAPFAYSNLPESFRRREDLALAMLKNDTFFANTDTIPDSLLTNKTFLRNAIFQNPDIAEKLIQTLNKKGALAEVATVRDAERAIDGAYEVLSITKIRDLGDVSEIIRNRYSVATHENRIKLEQLLGHDYFTGVERDTRPIAVVCLAEEDWNNAFDDDLKRSDGPGGLMQAYRLVYYQMNDDMDWQNGFLEATVNNNQQAEVLIIGGHGSRTSTEAGKMTAAQPGASHITIMDFPRYDSVSLQRGMSSDGTIVLTSCSTGWWTDRSEELYGRSEVDNVAEMYNRIFDADTWAPTVPSSASFEFNDEGKFVRPHFRYNLGTMVPRSGT